MKKRMLAALLLSALLFTLSGCGEKSLLNKKEPVSLTFWHVYGEQAGSFWCRNSTAPWDRSAACR